MHTAVNVRFPSLQSRTLMGGRSRSYGACASGLPLSLKSMSNGRARYSIGRREFTVDDGGYLLVNRDQSYSIEIASPTTVESFIVWFPDGWAEEIERSLTEKEAALLAEPAIKFRGRAHFFERYTRYDAQVRASVRRLHAAYRARTVLSSSWLEEQLRDLLVQLLQGEKSLQDEVGRLAARRAATREELWKRVNLARDFIHARCDTELSLTDIAEAAALSPYHLLRTFKAAFGLTPHVWLTRCRMERVRYFLARTNLSITEICFACGYESVGSFTTRFRELTGCSPAAWRRQNGAQASIRNFREVASRKI